MSLINTNHIFLDSTTARLVNGTYEFNLSPPIQEGHLQENYLYVTEFSSVNTLLNINDSNRIVSIIVGGQTYTGNLTSKNISTGTDLATALNTIFNTATTGNITFTFDVNTLKMIATHNANSPMTFAGSLFSDMLHYPVNEVVASPTTSSQAVDVHRATHNLYVSIQEISNSVIHVGSADNIPNRICKIPIVEAFGSYIMYQATLPIQKALVNGKMVNTLRVRLYSDDGQSFIPPRFTMTLAVETLQAQVDYENLLHDPLQDGHIVSRQSKSLPYQNGNNPDKTIPRII